MPDSRRSTAGLQHCGAAAPLYSSFLGPRKCLEIGAPPPHISQRVFLSSTSLHGVLHSACEPGARRARPVELRSLASMGLWFSGGTALSQSLAPRGYEPATFCALVRAVLRVSCGLWRTGSWLC